MPIERTNAPGLPPPADRDGDFDIAVVGVRSHTGEVLSVYLMDVDIQKLMEFLCWKHD